MVATRALRCAPNARPNSIHSFRRTTSSYSFRQLSSTRVRLNSATSEPAPEAKRQPQDGTTEDSSAAPNRNILTRKSRSVLEKSLGTENTTKLYQQAWELRKLNAELKHIFKAQHAVNTAMRGPYVVGGWKPDSPGLDEVRVQDNVVKTTKHEIPNIWLRDNCQCKSCVHEDTKQRLLDTFSIPNDISIKSSSETKDTIDIEWSDGHKSQYSKAFLMNAGSTAGNRSRIRQGLVTIDLWDASIAREPPRIRFKELEKDKSGSGSLVHTILNRVRRYGFCYITHVPPTPEATEALLRRISFIRETHYGGFYDFTADLASKDTAYTNIALEAHTDNTYFSDPAGLQAFHLLSHTDGSGGASLLVDGFNAAKQLLLEDRDAYETLATVNVHAHASGNQGISIMPYKGFPVLEHDRETGRLLQVRWNSSDRAAIELPLGEVGRWYDAARKFDRLLKKKKNEYWEQLQPGTVLIFDNWRVLHGRSAFTGKRRICGGYINRDDWMSKFKMMHFGQEEVLGKLASG